MGFLWDLMWGLILALFIGFISLMTYKPGVQSIDWFFKKFIEPLILSNWFSKKFVEPHIPSKSIEIKELRVPTKEEFAEDLKKIFHLGYVNTINGNPISKNDRKIIIDILQEEYEPLGIEYA